MHARQGLPHRGIHPLHHLVQTVREPLRGNVSAAQGTRRLKHGLRQLSQASLRPLCRRLTRPSVLRTHVSVASAKLSSVTSDG